MKKIFCFLIMSMCICNIVFASELPEANISSGNEDINISESGEINLDVDESDILTLNNDIEEYTENDAKTLKGTVIEAGEVYEESIGYMSFKHQDVKVHIKDKGYNTTKVIKYSITVYIGMEYTNPPLKVGDKVCVYTTFKDGNIESVAISGRDNTAYLIAIVVVYSLAIVIIGGVKGIKALISLILTILAVFGIILPQIINGANPLFVTILVSIIITFVAIVIIAGFNKKAIAAIAGTAGGIIIAGLFAIFFGNMMHLSGVTEDAMLLRGVEENLSFDFKGILFSGIIIGALGACMDVSMSIASALYELKQESPNLSVGKMMKAGMNIGKDMMGTMTNTLILAYTGGSIIIIIILMKSQFSFFEIINREMMLEEVLKAIAGSFGLVVTIPFTTLVTSLLMGKKK